MGNQILDKGNQIYLKGKVGKKKKEIKCSPAEKSI